MRVTFLPGRGLITSLHNWKKTIQSTPGRGFPCQCGHSLYDPLLCFHFRKFLSTHHISYRGVLCLHEFTVYELSNHLASGTTFHILDICNHSSENLIYLRGMNFLNSLCTLIICILKLSAEFKVFPQGLSNGIDRFNMCLNSTLVCRFIFTLITMIPSPIMNRFNVCLNYSFVFYYIRIDYNNASYHHGQFQCVS